MSKQEDDTVTVEVEEQMEDVFGDSEEPLDFSEESTEFSDFPLRDLKAIALSIDWEIDDEIMTQLNDEVEELKEKYRDDNVISIPVHHSQTYRSGYDRLGTYQHQ